MSPLAGIPARRASRAPARPPSAAPNASSTCSRRCTRGPCDRVTPSTCSTKVRRGQSAVPQRKRRTVRRMRTGRPDDGKSWSVRTYRLWTRVAARPQPGQAGLAAVDTASIVTRPSVAVTRVARTPAKRYIRPSPASLRPHGWRTEEMVRGTNAAARNLRQSHVGGAGPESHSRF